MKEELKEYKEMIQAFLDKKERTDYYETTSYDEFTHENVSMLVEYISDEELTKLRELKAHYGEDFVNHLIEVFDDEDFISDLFCGEYIDIDLDTVYHQYDFTICEVDGDKVDSRKFKVQLTDEEYSDLLAWHLYDNHLVINTLFYRDKILARKIMRNAMYEYSYDGMFYDIEHPFTIVMDEALADVAQIMQDNGIKKSDECRYLSVL
ncbi:MAG: hypothetical protein IJ914_11070 [Prevotella sp.]|nr:hypothetical protein [Prevotella sp.]